MNFALLSIVFFSKKKCKQFVAIDTGLVWPNLDRSRFKGLRPCLRALQSDQDQLRDSSKLTKRPRSEGPRSFGQLGTVPRLILARLQGPNNTVSNPIITWLWHTFSIMTSFLYCDVTIDCEFWTYFNFVWKWSNITLLLTAESSRICQSWLKRTTTGRSSRGSFQPRLLGGFETVFEGIAVWPRSAEGQFQADQKTEVRRTEVFWSAWNCPEADLGQTARPEQHGLKPNYNMTSDKNLN